MNVTVVAATTADGFIADSNKKMIAVSAEDAEFLSTQLVAHDVHVMGATTFTNMAAQFTKKFAHKRFVLTSRPTSYAAYSQLATFVSESLQHLLQNLQINGTKNVLVLGGSTIYNDCIQKALADTVYVTVEPARLQSGVPFLSDASWLQTKYRLTNEATLNTNGTLLRTYTKK